MAKEGRELVGATLGRRGFRQQDRDAKPTKLRGGRNLITYLPSGGINFGRASPLIAYARQQGGSRVPHLDIKPITARHVPMKNGKAHPRFTKQQGTAAGHFDYVTTGAVVTLAGHLDYVGRDAAVEDLEAGLVIDMVDEIALRGEKNRLAVYSNIPGGRERQRSLFEAAERFEPSPKINQLLASTADLEHLMILKRMAIACPGDMAGMVRRLGEARERVEREAEQKGKPVRHELVPIADVTAEQAHDWLTFFDEWQRGGGGKVEWQQGRTGRCQIRFVGELPHGVTPQERFAILQRFCDMLGSYGHMVVGAIHHPDPHGNSRNYHFHVDAYPRPAKWMDEHGCWDFEYSERRNGRVVHPYRQNKVRYGEAGLADGKMVRVNDAALIRERYIDIVNAVVGERVGVVRFLHGTYADNDIPLTPLEHMGNRAIAAEKSGIETEVGTRNAHRIISDQLRACERRVEAREQELGREVELMRGLWTGDARALHRIDEYEGLCRRAIERRAQAEICDVIIGMARSRADAVIRASADRVPGQRRRAGDEALLKAARDHVAWVERTQPTDRERHNIERSTAKSERQAETLRVGIMDALDRPPTPALHYHSRERADARLAPVHPAYEDQMRERLLRWIETHRDDPERLVIGDDEVSLGAGVQRAIDTLMRRFAADQAIQTALLKVRSRRRQAAAAEAARIKPLEPLTAEETQAIRNWMQTRERRALMLSKLPKPANALAVSAAQAGTAIPDHQPAVNPNATSARSAEVANMPAPALQTLDADEPRSNIYDWSASVIEHLVAAARAAERPRRTDLSKPVGPGVPGERLVGAEPTGVRELSGVGVAASGRSAQDFLPDVRRDGLHQGKPGKDGPVRRSGTRLGEVASRDAGGASSVDGNRLDPSVEPVSNNTDLLQSAWRHLQGSGQGR